MLFPVYEYQRSIILHTQLYKFSFKNSIMFNFYIIDKITLNHSLKDLNFDKIQTLYSINALELLSGTKTMPKRSRKTVATLKIRAGIVVGTCAVLRKKKMYIFLSKLLQFILPNSAELKSFSHKMFNQHGSLNFSIKDILALSELEQEFEKVGKINKVKLNFTTKKKAARQVDLSNKNLAIAWSSFQLPTY